MTIYTDQAWGAVVVFGLPDPASPQSGKGVVFTNGLFVLPAEIPAATYTAQAWLTDLGGETFTANLRTPCSAGGTIRAVVDDVDGLLSKILVKDPTLGGWYLESARLLPATTVFVISNSSGLAPTVNQILWIEAEAMKVTNVVAQTSGSWSITVTRGQCGSFAVTHQVRPSVYWIPGADETKAKIPVTSKPEPTRNRFLARAYRLRETELGAAVSHYRDGYLARVSPRFAPEQWEFTFEPVAKLIEEHEVRAGVSPTALSHGVEILSMGYLTNEDGTHRQAPNQAVLWLTAKEAALFFDWPFRQPGSAGLDATLVTAAQAVFASTALIPQLCHIGSASGEGTYEITSLEQVSAGVWPWVPQEEFIRVGLIHRASTIDLMGKKVLLFPVLPGNSPLNLVRYQGGFAESSAAPLLASDTPPTVELWLLPLMTTANFFATVLASDCGDSGRALDLFPPGVGIALPDSFINYGAPAGSPSLDTLALAELDQLLTQPYLLPLKPGASLADILNNLCRLHRLVPTPLAAGGMTLRPWARPFSSAANPVVLEQVELEILQDVQPLRAMEFVAGVDLLTFEPTTKTPRLATVMGTKTKERGDLERVWIYSNIDLLPNNNGTDPFDSGDLFDCCRAFFVTLQGEPIVLRGMTDLDVSVYQTVDYLTLSDDSVPTYLGRGVTNKRYIVISVGLSWNDSGQPLLLLPDELNNTALQTTGKIAPTLIVREVRQILGAGPYTIKVRVDSIGDVTFDPNSAHGGIWAAIVAGVGYVLIRRPVHAQVNDPTKDGKGWREAYATLSAVSYIGPEGELTLSLSALWLHDGLTVADYLVRDQTFISLMDLDTANRLGVRVEPRTEQLYSNGTGLDFAKFDGQQPFDFHRTVIGV